MGVRYGNYNVSMECTHSWWRHQTGPLCGEFTGHRWIPYKKIFNLTKASGAWMNGWVNNHEAGGLRRYGGHYDVTGVCFSVVILAVFVQTWCVVHTFVILLDWHWNHDDVIKWKHFRRYWPFVWAIHRSPVNSPHKGQWRRVWCFLWSAPE